MSSSLIDPSEGITNNFGIVDEQIKLIQGDHPIEVIEVHMRVALVSATCALVHAVRELTAEVRKSNTA